MSVSTDENFNSKRRASRVINKPLSTEEFEELTKVAFDPFFFSTFIYVINPVLGRVPFDLFPYQRSVLMLFIKYRFTIIKKFRQAGLTELISLLCLWYAMYHSNKTINIISIKDAVAKKVLRKIKFMYRNLPDHLKVQIINGRSKDLGTATELEFANGSLITSIPTTEEAGRSEALSLLVIDEAAIIRWADQIWGAAFPTLSTGGRSILNSCITGDTEIMTDKGLLRVDTICPPTFGKWDVSQLGYKALTHTGEYKPIIGAVNKGQLETWEIENSRGKILKATPTHKLLTINGWKPISQIIEEDGRAIFYDLTLSEKTPKTKKPKKEVLKEVKGYPNYMVSNMGKIYIRKQGAKLVEKPGSTNNWGYISIKLWNGGKSKKFSRNRLIATHFIGDIPKGYIVDHINCNKQDDYVTNLQIITIKENSVRGAKYSSTHRLGVTRQSGKFSNLQLVAYIQRRYKYYKKKNTKGFYSIIAKQCKKRFNVDVNRPYIAKVGKGDRCSSIYTSKLKIKRKYVENIYDVCVEKNESYLTKTEYINHNTPYGVGNFFHKKWVEACSGGNEFIPINLKWQMHPHRGKDGEPATVYPDDPNYDPYWYNKMAAALGPRRTAQEIDGDFLTSGSSVFDLLDIRAIEESLDEHIPLDLKPYSDFQKLLGKVRPLGDNLKIFKLPDPKRRFAIGSDVATGRARDYSAFTIMDDLGEEYGSFKMKIPVNELATLLGGLGNIYNRALVAPESNDIGLAVSSKLQEDRYPKLHYSYKLVKEKRKKKPKQEKIPGWYTTSKNRPVIIGELEEDIRLGNCLIKDEAFVQEAYTFIYDEKNKAVAMGKGSSTQTEDVLADDDGYTDDAILGKAITNHVRKIKQKGLIMLPV